MKKVENFQLKIVIFTAMKNRCILHGRVFVLQNLAIVPVFPHPWLLQKSELQHWSQTLTSEVPRLSARVLFTWELSRRPIREPEAEHLYLRKCD